MNELMKFKRRCLQITVIAAVLFTSAVTVHGEPLVPFKFGFNVEPAQNARDVSSSIQILLLLTVLSLAPSIIIMMTSFTRIIIILSFLRNALGTQQMPPNQVLIGLALFLSLFIMNPIVQDINENAFQPYTQEKIDQQTALDKSSGIIRDFMIKQIFNNDKSGKDLELFVSLAKIDVSNGVDPQSLPLTVVIPAFLISELTVAFKIGFLIFIPFLIIDMVVSSTLMSMGMMMLPPSMISLPFKILLFVTVGGWNLVTQMIVGSFAR